MEGLIPSFIMKLQEWQRTEKYIPLTYLEVLRGKPLIVKLNDEWNFVTNLQKSINFKYIGCISYL